MAAPVPKTDDNVVPASLEKDIRNILLKYPLGITIENFERAYIHESKYEFPTHLDCFPRGCKVVDVLRMMNFLIFEENGNEVKVRLEKSQSDVSESAGNRLKTKYDAVAEVKKLRSNSQGVFTICFKPQRQIEKQVLYNMFERCGKVIDVNFEVKMIFIRFDTFDAAAKAIRMYGSRFGILAGKLRPGAEGPHSAHHDSRSCYNCKESGHLSKDCPKRGNGADSDDSWSDVKPGGLNHERPFKSHNGQPAEISMQLEVLVDNLPPSLCNNNSSTNLELLFAKQGINIDSSKTKVSSEMRSAIVHLLSPTDVVSAAKAMDGITVDGNAVSVVPRSIKLKERLQKETQHIAQNGIFGSQRQPIYENRGRPLPLQPHQQSHLENGAFIAQNHRIVPVLELHDTVDAFRDKFQLQFYENSRGSSGAKTEIGYHHQVHRSKSAQRNYVDRRINFRKTTNGVVHHQPQRTVHFTDEVIHEQRSRSNTLHPSSNGPPPLVRTKTCEHSSTRCPNFPKCSLEGHSCPFMHPLCPQSQNCQNRVCKFFHENRLKVACVLCAVVAAQKPEQMPPTPVEEFGRHQNAPAQNRSSNIPCRYGPTCRYKGTTCTFLHDFVLDKQTPRNENSNISCPHSRMPCKNYPKCGYGDACDFQHPNCNFGGRCRVDGCPMRHNCLGKAHKCAICSKHQSQATIAAAGVPKDFINTGGTDPRRRN